LLVFNAMANTSKQAAKQAIVTQKDFNLIIRVLKANWWIPIIIVPIFYVMSVFYIFRLTSVYQVTTKILLQNNNAYYQSNVVTDANFYGAQNYVDNSNEQRVILSYDLLDRVVTKLKDKLQVSYYIVGKVRRTEQFGNMPFLVNVNTINADLYEVPFDFKVLNSKSYEITYQTGDKPVILKGEFNKDLVNLDFNIVVKTDPNIQAEQIGTLKDIFYQFIIHSNDYLIENISGNASVVNPDYTNILEVHLNDIIPQRAVLILDSLNEEYFFSKLKSKLELNEKTIEYIDKQLDEISVLLKASVDTLQSYKQSKSIVNLGWEESDFLGKISLYDNQRTSTQLQIHSLDDLEKYIIEDKDPQFLPPSVFIVEKEGFLPKAAFELYTKQLELNRMYGVAKEENPAIQDQKANINKLKQDLLVYITNARSALKTSIGNINEQIAKYVGEAKSIPPKQQELLGFQRKLNVNESIYNFLLEKRASTRIARASIVPEATVIETPRDTGEVSPDRKGIKKTYLTIGFVVSILVIIIRSLFFTKIKDVEHLKELSDIPSIGIIPFIKKQDEMGVVVDSQPNSIVAESFRNIRTNLQYANVGNNTKTFLVTSFSPGEGKTFTSINLATTLAKSGKKTIILELDLHKPKVYKNLGLSAPMVGITTYITKQSAIEDIVKPCEIKDLYCMFAGPIPPNPSEFVLSERLKDLIGYAKENFDYVIIDSPPAGLLSDSVFLMQYVDSTLFVLNANTSTRKTISFVHEVRENNNIQNLLFILNGVRNLGKRYYYKGYGYSYGYGYGYGYGKGYGYRK
jgi:capsular exopolysaccharide synthesis family protein